MPSFYRTSSRIWPTMFRSFLKQLLSIFSSVFQLSEVHSLKLNKGDPIFIVQICIEHLMNTNQQLLVSVEEWV